MTARDRVDFLLDDDAPSMEVGALAAFDMYADEGGAPSAGVVVVIGYVSDKLCIVVANDATVKAGAWFPMTGKKNLRAQEIAMENQIPIISFALGPAGNVSKALKGGDVGTIVHGGESAA